MKWAGWPASRRRPDPLGLADAVRSIPIVDPVVNDSIGMVIPQRDPMTPLIAALVHVARGWAVRFASCSIRFDPCSLRADGGDARKRRDRNVETVGP